MKRIVVVVLLAVICGAVLTGCWGGSNTKPRSSQKPSFEQTVIDDHYVDTVCDHGNRLYIDDGDGHVTVVGADVTCKA